MDTRGECLPDRLKLVKAEDRLIFEKNNLHDIKQKYKEEKQKWMEEIKGLEEIIHNLEDEVKIKQQCLANVKQQLEEIFYKPRELEMEIEMLEKENKKLKREHEVKKSKHIKHIILEKELVAVQQMRKDLQVTTKWLKEVQESDRLETDEAEKRYQVKEEETELWKDVEEKLKMYDQTMRELDDMSLSEQKQRLEDLHECRAKLEVECKQIEKKNKKLELKLKQLEEEEPDSNLVC